MSHATGRHIKADPQHGILERLSILTSLDRIRVGSDHFNTQLVQLAGSMERHCGIECRLPTERRQQYQLALGAAFLDLLLFDLNDFLDRLWRDRLDVRPICKLRVGHDRRRVGVNEYHAVALLP